MSEIRVDRVLDESGLGAVELIQGATLPSGKTISGSGTIAVNSSGTAAGLSGTPDITVGNITGVAATFTGVVTYEDVTNVDSVGIITARQGVFFGTSGNGTQVVGDNTGIGIGTDNPDSPLDIRSTSTLPAQFVTTTAGSSGATLRIRKNDTATLQADDTIGDLQFAGSNNTDVSVYEYASIETKVVTGTPGSEDGVLNLKTATGGTATTKLSIDDTTCTFTAGLVEKYEKAGTTLGSQTNNPIADGNVILFTGNESGNNTINFTGVHAKLADGETCSFTVILTPNGSGGSAPSAGSSGQDIYTFQILKTGTGTSDYTVFGAATNYA